MNAEMKNRLKACFGYESRQEDRFGAICFQSKEIIPKSGDGQEDCFGAIPYMEENLGRIHFADDSDMRDLIDVILYALKLDGNNVKFVEFLVSKGFDINYKLAGDNCLLLKYVDDAQENGVLDLDVVKRLTELGADVCSETMDGDNVISLLAGRDEQMAVYMAMFYDLTLLDKTDKYGATPLMYAAMRGYNRFAKILLERGFDVNATGSAPVGEKSLDIETDGVSPLALAIRFGNVEMVRMLLEAGADETICDAKGDPPIFSLVRYPVDFFREFFGQLIKEDHPIFQNKREIVSMLEQLDLTDADGYTVLMRSLLPMKFWYTGHGKGISAKKNLPITLELIKRGADVDVIGNDGRRPLHQAVVEVEEAARALVNAGADINAQDNDGDTPLMYACMTAKEETVLWLLKAGADYTLQNNAGKTAADLAAQKGYTRALEWMGSDGTLLQACMKNQKGAVQVILKRDGIDLNERDDEGNTSLCHACWNNALDIVKMLLDAGADPNIANKNNDMPLHFAAVVGNFSIIHLLVKAGADVNCRNSRGDTPLMYMAQQGKTSAALNYIKNPEVDVSIQSNAGRTAAMYAISAKQQQLVKAFLPMLGTETDDTDAEGNTMLHYACHFGQIEIVKILIQRNLGSVNKANDSGETPLIMASRNSNLVAAKLLLEAGAAVGHRSVKGLTALHLAAAGGNVFLGRALLEAGADINERTKEGHTPLIYAITEKKSEFAEMLILEGADVNAVDNEGYNAIAYAMDAEMPQIVELMLAMGAEG